VRPATVTVWVLAAGLLLGGMAHAEPPEPESAMAPPSWLTVMEPQPWETGQASRYHPRFEGRRTASGEPYRNHTFSAAHRSLPLGTLITVRNPDNEREVVVRINDRGPHHPERDLDLSHAAAKALGILRQGVADIEWRLAAQDASPTPPVRPSQTVRRSPKPRHKTTPTRRHKP